jgi:peptidoglycan hydrolase CwlO-like protein
MKFWAYLLAIIAVVAVITASAVIVNSAPSLETIELKLNKHIESNETALDKIDKQQNRIIGKLDRIQQTIEEYHGGGANSE